MIVIRASWAYSICSKGNQPETYTLEGLDELNAAVRRHDVLGQDNGLSILVGAVLAEEAHVLHVLLNSILGLCNDLQYNTRHEVYRP